MTAPDEVSIGAQATTGVAWSAAQKWAIRLTGFASVALLARLLSPEDFGLVAAATTIMPLLYLLSDLGFSTYLVQAERVDARMLGTAFWFSASAGMGLAAVLVAVAPLVADALSIDGLTAVLRVLAVAVLAAAFGSVPTAILKRRMDFKAIAVRSGIASVLGQVVAVVTALIGWGVWALVIQLIVTQVVSCALIWHAARWVPTRGFSVTEFKRMTSFGASVVGIECVAILSSWAEYAIIAMTLGASGLGFLNIAQRLIQISQDLTVSAVTPVMTVAFARIRASADRIRGAYLRVTEVTYAVAIPFVAALTVAAPLIIPLVFGTGWAASIAPSQAWALASFMLVGAVVDQSLFYGVGRPATWLVYALALNLVTVGVTAVAVRFDLIGVALGSLLASVVALAGRSIVVARVLEARYPVVLAPFARGFLVLAGSSFAIWAVLAATPGLYAVVRLVLAALAAAACYWLAVRVLMPQAAVMVRGLASRVARPLRTVVLRGRAARSVAR